MKVDKIFNAIINFSTKKTEQGAKTELSARPAKLQKSEGPSKETAQSTKKGFSLFSIGPWISKLLSKAPKLSKLLSKTPKSDKPAVVTGENPKTEKNLREMVRVAERIVYRDGNFQISPDYEDHSRQEVLASLKPADTDLLVKLSAAYTFNGLTSRDFIAALDEADESGKLTESYKQIQTDKRVNKFISELSEGLQSPENPLLDMTPHTEDAMMHFGNVSPFKTKLEKQEISDQDSSKTKAEKLANNYFHFLQGKLENYDSLTAQDKGHLANAMTKTNTPPHVLQKYLMVYSKSPGEAIRGMIVKPKRFPDLNENYIVSGTTPKEKAEGLEKLLEKRKLHDSLFEKLRRIKDKIDDDWEQADPHPDKLALAAVLNELRKVGVVVLNEKNLPVAGEKQPFDTIGRAIDVIYTELETLSLEPKDIERDKKTIEIAKAAGFSLEDIQAFAKKPLPEEKVKVLKELYNFA